MSESEGGSPLRALLAVFDFKVAKEGIEEGENLLSGFFKKVKEVGEGIIAAFAVEAVYEFAEGQAKAMHAVERTAAMLGLSTERVQQFQFAAKSLGEDGDTLTGLMGRLQVAQAGVTAGAKGAGAAFTRLGIATKDTHGKSKGVDVLFLDTAEALSKITDPAKQAAAASQLFGRGGRELLPILKEGKAGLSELLEQYKELGGGYTKEAIEEGKKFEAASARQSVAMTGLKNTISQAVLPIVTKLVTWSTSLAKGFAALVKNTNIVQVALGALGLAALAVTWPLIAAAAPVIAMGIALAALLLVAEDIVGLFTGKDSLIGEWIDDAFGKGQSTELVKSLKSAWDDVGGAIKKAWEYVKEHTEEIRTGLKILGYVSLVTPTYQAAKEFGEAVGDYSAASDDNDGGGPMGVTSRTKNALVRHDGKAMVDAAISGGRPKLSASILPPTKGRGGTIEEFHGPLNIHVTLDPDKVKQIAHVEGKKAATDHAKGERKRAHRTLPQGTAQ